MRAKLLTSALVACGLVFSLTAGAMAEVSATGASAAAGSASSVSGKVTIVRGAKTFQLKANDQIFPGDRILSGADGATSLSVNGCVRSLSANQSISVDDQFCTKELVALSEADKTVLAQQGGGMGVGATAGVLGAAGAAGAAAAVGGGGGGGGSPSSP